jgi:ATP-dependent Clp protease ATP-binding subunit ClpX
MITKLYDEIYNYLDQYVIGQSEAKDKLAILGYLYAYRCQSVEAGVRSQSLPKLNMFLTGPTGTGKTLLLRTLADCLDVPFIRIDCTSVSQAGWEGVSIDDQLMRFTKISNKDGFGVIMLDEFDKLGNLVTSSSGSTPNLGVQYNLLDLLDGVYSHPNVHETINNSLILCAGAFSEATKQAKKSNKSIGFRAYDQQEKIDWKEVMVKGGIVPELTGRLLDIIELSPLKKNEIKKVILNPKGGTYTQYKNLLMDINFTQKDVDKLARSTYNSEYGLRELDTSIFNMVKDKLLKDKKIGRRS